MANLANRLRFAKLKPSKLVVVTIDNPLADLLIRQTFFRQTLEKSRFAKHSARQTFPLYGTELVNGLILIGYMEVKHSLLYYVLLVITKCNAPLMVLILALCCQ